MLSEELIILCVDDDERLLNLFEVQLAKFKVKVVTANSAKKAFELLEKGLDPNVILCDVMMPGEDGYAFHKRVRDNPKWLRVPFIYVTALGQYDDYRVGMDLGADGYLSKPFTQQQLVQEIKLVLSRNKDLSKQGQVTINLIGTQNVRCGDVLHKAPDRGAEQLTFYLILQGRGEIKRRTDVMAELWTEITLSGFRSVLSRAKRWSEGWANWHITNKTMELSLRENTYCDLYDLEDALVANDLRRIDKLYKGPLLPSYQDDWVVHKRDILTEKVKSVLVKALDKSLPARERVQSYKRLLEVDPDDFEIWEAYNQSLEEAGLNRELNQPEGQVGSRV